MERVSREQKIARISALMAGDDLLFTTRDKFAPPFTGDAGPDGCQLFSHFIEDEDGERVLIIISNDYQAVITNGDCEIPKEYRAWLDE